MPSKPNAVVAALLNPSRCAVVPLMTSPGIALIGAAPREVFGDGELQFRCVRALADATPATLAVTFMDLSVEAEAFGAPLRISETENPTVAAPVLADPGEIAALRVPEVGEKRTAETLRCARLCAAGIDRPVLGGMIGPFSLAGRLADLTEMMILAAVDPGAAHELLEKVTGFLIGYARAIRASGVAGLIVAEPAAGLLSPEMCGAFAAAYLKRIVDAVQDETFPVVLHNCGRTERQIPELLSAGAAALHVGNAVDLADILPQVPARIPLMGNLDPVGVLKNGTPETVGAAVRALLAAHAGAPNYVLSTGCDVPPGVPPENIRAFYDAWRRFGDRP